MAVRSVVLSGKRIITGVGALNSLSEYRYRRVAIVTGGSSMTRYGIIDRVKALFKGNGSEVFVISGIKKNPSFEEVFDGLKILNDFAPDCIVAVGGGSAIDCAKAMLLFYEFPYLNKANVLEFNSEGKIPKERKCGLICIPSTSGTGSEVTRGAVITDTEQKLKVPIMTDCLRPDVAILDPEVTLTMPSNIVAETGLDALTHAIESYTNKKLDDFDAALSMAAIAGIMKYLPASYHEGTLEAREKVHNYQAMAGISFANVGLGMVHGMAHSFGAAFNMGHGLTNAIILPYALRFNSQDAEVSSKLTELSYACHCDDIIAEIEKLRKDFGIPNSYKEAGISEEQYLENRELLLEHAMLGATLVNPVPMTKESMSMMLDKVYYGL